MILLLGGTSETAPIAKALVEEGFGVLISMATSIPLRGELGSDIRRRTGKLNAEEMVSLIRGQGIRAVVDATHPYASAVSANAWTACQQTGIPYVAYERPSAAVNGPDIHWATDHPQAATLACSFSRPLLLTIGVRNLAPYVAAARHDGIRITARVFDHPSSVEACSRMGLNAEEIVCANGPFSVAENTALIVQRQIGVLVTKDSGDAGGVPAKIEAARQVGCAIVVVKRPPRPEAGYSSIPELIEAVRLRLSHRISHA